jgi:exodeoxyribonuclease VII small subunit
LQKIIKVEKEMTYTESLQRLRTLVAEMEKNTSDVDSLFDSVQEASRLIGYCREKLSVADGEIRKMLEDLA